MDQTHEILFIYGPVIVESQPDTHNDSGDLGSILHFKICTMQCSISATNHSTADDGSLMQIDFIKQ